MVQPCIWFKEEPSQFSMGQTAQSLTCSIMEKPHTGQDDCPRILLSCFRARTPGCRSRRMRKGEAGTKCELMDVDPSLPSSTQHTTCVQCNACSEWVHGISTLSHHSECQSDLVAISKGFLNLAVRSAVLFNNKNWPYSLRT